MLPGRFVQVNGRALGVAYLEWLVSSGSAPPIMHDEYALLLIEGERCPPL